MNRWIVAALFGLLSFTAQAREPFTSGEGFVPEDEAETVAWKVSDLAYSDNVKRRAVSPEFAALEAYAQSVLDKVYPEFKGKLRVRVLPDIGSNALAMPNGDIYIGGGILARMSSEAQLAALLGHEAAHVVYRHGVDGVETQLAVTGAISLVNTAVNAVPLPVASLVNVVTNPLVRMATQYGVSFTAISSLYGFSRARERQADEIGFTRMVAAGYDPKEAAKLFEALAIESAFSQASKPFFFASHPAMESRVESYRELAQTTPKVGSFVGEAEFDAQVRPYRSQMIERELRWFRHRSLVGYFERPEVAALYAPGQAAFYLGEAYRRHGTQVDMEKAPAAYRRAVAEGYPASKVMEPLVLAYLRLKQGDKALDVIEEWIAQGKPADSLDLKEYQAQADRLIKETSK